MASYYAFTEIRHDDEVIEYGTKITQSMLPKDTVKHMLKSGSIVNYDPNEVEVEEVEVEEEDNSSSESNNQE